jgi:hypothetical protein
MYCCFEGFWIVDSSTIYKYRFPHVLCESVRGKFFDSAHSVTTIQASAPVMNSRADEAYLILLSKITFATGMAKLDHKPSHKHPPLATDL